MINKLQKKNALIVQSYEELPYLLWFIKSNKNIELEDKNLIVLSYGGYDFLQHLNLLLKKINSNFKFEF